MPRTRCTRSATASKLSPSGGVTLVSRNHFRCNSGSFSAASKKVRPSHAPKSVSIRSSSTVTSSPSALAAFAAVSYARCSGDAMTALTPPRFPEVVRSGFRLPLTDVGQCRVAAAGIPALRRQFESARAATAATGSARRGHLSSPATRSRPSPSSSAAGILQFGRRVHRLVGQPVGVAVLGPRDPRVGDAVELFARTAVACSISGAQVGVLDPPAAGHLLHHQLRVHPHLDVGGAHLGGFLQACDQTRGTRRRCWWRCRSPACSRRAPVSRSAVHTTAP